ncbi:hypothetical protein [Microbacterium kribbense]|uniref:hypothetical protein n=1 Tax=Microbacterium kribbense TaxID=433645 RepID=UPI0031DE82E7
MYFPHGQPINAHTCSGRSLDSSLNPFGRIRRRSTCSAGSGSGGPVSICRAFDLPIPVVVVTSQPSKAARCQLAVRPGVRHEALRVFKHHHVWFRVIEDIERVGVFGILPDARNSRTGEERL